MLINMMLPKANPATPSCSQSRRDTGLRGRSAVSAKLSSGSYPSAASNCATSLNLTLAFSNEMKTSLRGKFTRE